MSKDVLHDVTGWLQKWWLQGSKSAYFARLSAAAAAIFGLRQGLAEFELHPFPVTTAGICHFVSAIVILHLLGEIWRGQIRDEDNQHDNLSSAFLRHLDGLIADDKYEAVVRYHIALSRLLWVEGQLEARIEIGKRIAKAAAAIGDNRILTAVLIDDLGWTLVALKQFDEAKSNIGSGIELANMSQDHYWLAKGHRHLAGIAVETKSGDVAVAEFRLAREHAQSIESTNVRHEMLAGIDYGEAVFRLRSNEAEAALTLVDSSEHLRKQVGDESRIVKCYALRGEVEEHLGRINSARQQFERGLRLAKKIGRVDEEIRCLQGMARIERNPNTKIELEQQASILKSKTPITYDSR